MLLCDLYKRSYLRNANFNFHLLKNAKLQKRTSHSFQPGKVEKHQIDIKYVMIEV